MVFKSVIYFQYLQLLVSICDFKKDEIRLSLIYYNKKKKVLENCVLFHINHNHKSVLHREGACVDTHQHVL